MILFENTIIKLEYDPASDIIETAYPALHEYLVPEIKNTITQMVEVIRNYDVKNLLLDSSRSLNSIGGEESASIASYLATGLAKTRLRKLARVQSPSNVVESQAQNIIKRIQSSQSLSFQLKSFSDKGEARRWLMARD